MLIQCQNKTRLHPATKTLQIASAKHFAKAGSLWALWEEMSKGRYAAFRSIIRPDPANPIHTVDPAHSIDAASRRSASRTNLGVCAWSSEMVTVKFMN
jgi:hypothetical protein